MGAVLFLILLRVPHTFADACSETFTELGKVRRSASNRFVRLYRICDDRTSGSARSALDLRRIFHDSYRVLGDLLGLHSGNARKLSAFLRNFFHLAVYRLFHMSNTCSYPLRVALYMLSGEFEINIRVDIRCAAARAMRV